ncbi:MAG: PDZ domain-containing protein [Ferrimonas sp.]
MIHYQIQPVDPLAHLFAVEIHTDQALPQQQFHLPAWLPGSYMIRDFARHLIQLEADDGQGNGIALTQLDKQSWQAQTQGGSLRLRYQVYAWDLSVRGAHLDQTHGFFNGSSTFLALHQQEEQPVTLTILAPEGECYRDWRVATAMPLDGAQRYQFGRYKADDYAELIDHPVEMGTFTLAHFEAGGVTHDLVLTGQHWADTDRICADLQKICQAQIEFFGGAPFNHYLFMTQVIGDGFGGLEHRASTALVCGRHDLPSVHQPELTDGYRTYLTLCSHEYFHSWNVKRIKPASFMPYQLHEESYTKQLWAYEGITSYFDDLFVYRAGCINAETYLDQLAQGLTKVTRGSGRFKQTLRESSFNAWTKFYKQDENATNAIVSYYTKGAMFALYLDLSIRLESQGKHSLDCVMQRLWQQYGQQNIGTDDNSHQQIVAELLGRDVSDLFQWLDNTDDLPLKDLLAKFGCSFTIRPTLNQEDKGGRQAGVTNIDWGATTRAGADGVHILAVKNGSSAHLAGLAAGDKLIAINNLQITNQVEARLAKYGVHSQLTLHWFRRDELMEGALRILPAQADTVAISITDNTLIRSWL